MQADDLPLRDLHVPPPPPWWPPAPGWWLAAGVLLVLAVGLCAWWLRRRRRARAIARMFDEALEHAGPPAAQVAAMSGLLRRAARRIDPRADRLEGEQWLQFLDAGLPRPVFATGPGALLLEGAFRRDVGQPEVDALRAIARARFLQWMGAAR